MRKLFALATLGPAALFFTLAPFVLSGCGEGENVVGPTVQPRFVIHGKVFEGDAPQQASLLVLWDGNEQELQTALDGSFSIEVEHSPQYLVAVLPGKSGVLEGPFQSEATYTLSLTRVVEAARPPGETSPLTEYWFGVYDTDSHGDVRFRYQYAFSRFHCINWMPYLGEGGPNPNNWTSWSLSGFPPPWHGKKLLVPGRYQTYHRLVYGYSISGALYLIASR